MACHFKLHCSYIVVKLQFYIVKIASLESKRDLKDLNGWKYVQLWNCFKTAFSLRRNRYHFTCKVI